MRIDTSRIEGFDSMTPEEQVKALLDNDFVDEKMKRAFEKASSDIADYKKKLQDKMTDDEKKAEERAEWEKSIQSKLDEAEARAKKAERENLVNKHTASFLANGYDQKLAESSAKAMADGNFEQVFKDLGAHLKANNEAIREELLKSTPKPAGAGGSDVMTKAKFLEMTSEEQSKYKAENPNWRTDLK